MTNLKYKFKSFLKFTLKILALLLIATLVYFLGDYSYNLYLEKQDLKAEVQRLKDLREAEKQDLIKDLKTEVLNKLYRDEFGGNWKKRRASGDNLETFDPANRNYKKCIKRGGEIRSDCLSLGVGQIQLERAMIFQNQLIKAGIYKKENKLTEREMKAKLLGDTKFYDKFILDAVLNIRSSIYKWSSAPSSRAFYDSKIKELRKLLNIKL